MSGGRYLGKLRQELVDEPASEPEGKPDDKPVSAMRCRIVRLLSMEDLAGVATFRGMTVEEYLDYLEEDI